MNNDLMEGMLRHGEYDKLITQLQQEEELNEKETLVLIQAYLLADNEDKALRIAYKFTIDGEDDDYKTEAKEIIRVLCDENENKINEYKQKLKDSFRKQEETFTEEKFFLEDIEDLFEGTVGMERAKESLQTYLSCRSLDEERNLRDLLCVTKELHNFAIIGERGSGKTHLSNLICEMLHYEEKNIITIYMKDVKEPDDIEKHFNDKGIAIIFDNLEDFFLDTDILQKEKGLF